MTPKQRVPYQRQMNSPAHSASLHTAADEAAFADGLLGNGIAFVAVKGDERSGGAAAGGTEGRQKCR